MSLFEISSVLLTAAALGSFVNYKWMKLPESIGLMLLAMSVGLLGLGLEHLGLFDTAHIEKFLENINFSETVFHGMLSFLLFAGALQIKFEDLKLAKLPIAITATFSTLISMVLIGYSFYFIANLLGFHQITLLIAFLLGAIISPTDPIAVMAIIRKLNAPKSIEIKIAGESLFNDGVAIVFYLTILELITKGGDITLLNVAGSFIREAGGGLVIGGILGWAAYQLLLKIDSYHTELLITLALTTGGYVLAERMHVSAPLAMVVAGIIIGNQGRNKTASKKPRTHIASFWEVTDEILNAALFILIGLEMMVIKTNGMLVMLASIGIFLTLLIRYISVAIPIQLMQPFYSFNKGTAVLMTWGGLRGALSIAMVLALPDQHVKDIFLPCVYFIVVFSIAVQGMTFGKLLKIYGLATKK